MRHVILIRLTNIFLASCCTRLLINTMSSFHLIVLNFARWRRYVYQNHRTEKDGDWYIYPYFLVNESLKKAHKNAKKSSKTFKLSIHNVVSTGTNLCKNMAFYVPTGFVRFARYCGNMYSHHLRFSVRWINNWFPLLFGSKYKRSIVGPQ